MNDLYLQHEELEKVEMMARRWVYFGLLTEIIRDRLG